MPRLNPIEEECKQVLRVILDLMGPGRRRLSAVDHRELTGNVREALHHLVNKEYGCLSGKHVGTCHCKPDES